MAPELLIGDLSKETHPLGERPVLARAGSRPARARVNHDDRALRQPETGEPAGKGAEVETDKTFDQESPAEARRHDEKRTDGGAKVSSFFQDQAKVPKIDDQKIDRETASNLEDENELEAWLAVRDGIRNWLLTAA
jgi:hypothetical protein